MFLKQTIAHGKDYYYVAESVREGARIKTKIIRNLGHLSNEGIEYWKAVLTYPTFGAKILTDSYTFFYDKRSRRHGIPALFHAIWKSLGIDKILYNSLSRVSSRSQVARLVEIMVINRFEDPCSKLKLLDWIPKTSLPYLLDNSFSDLNETSFYRAMDALWERRDRIEVTIYKTIVEPLCGSSSCSVLAKDITSTYFEGTKAEIGKYGYSRDHRPDLKQVNWSLVETEAGYPITLEVYDGKRRDSTTVEESIVRLKTLFRITRGIFIVDRGMSTEKNIKLITSEGFDYIAAELLSKKHVRSVVDEALSLGFEEWLLPAGEDDDPVGIQTKLASDGVRSTNNNKVKGRELFRNGSRYLVVFNPEKQREEIEKLERNVELGENIISGVEKYAVAHPNKIGSDPSKVIGLVTRKLAKMKLTPYFTIGQWDQKQGKISFIRTKKVETDRKYAGIWVLRTDLGSEKKTPLEIIRMYKGLWVLEHTFREVKSSLDLRPMWHRKADRIRAHIWICVLAYLIERIVESIVRREQGASEFKEMTGNNVFESFRDIRLTEIGIRGQEEAGGRSYWTVTQLEEVQKKILQAMKIDPELITNVPQQKLVA
jgi:transposase